MVLLIEGSRLGKSIETKSKIMFARCWRDERIGSQCSVGTEFHSGKMKNFWKWTMMVYTTMCMYLMPLNCTHFKNGENRKFYVVYILP